MALGNTRVIALEEHYWDPEIAKVMEGNEGRRAEIRRRLDDLGDLRLREMDEARIDMQVLSHGAPSLQRLDAARAVPLARQANDHLFEAVQEHPDRFRAFAVLPTADPQAAAAELDRAVTQLGFVGAMVCGPSNGVFFDEKQFWPICAQAEALDVPLYLHPAIPKREVVDAYYQPYIADFPGLQSSAWGYTVETATQGIRMVLSGVFDTYPKLKIILGHMGESLPFSLWRIDQSLSRPGNKPIQFREVFTEHFWITTSGNFSTPALLCSMLELGIDRIMFSVDYPFVDNPPGTAWMEAVPLSAEDRGKILNGNARRLLKLD